MNLNKTLKIISIVAIVIITSSVAYNVFIFIPYKEKVRQNEVRAEKILACKEKIKEQFEIRIKPFFESNVTWTDEMREAFQILENGQEIDLKNCEVLNK